MSTQSRDPGPDGVLIVDKPSGPTSFQIVAQARRLYRTRKVGHCGTLDPLASGVLVVVFGEAAKLSGHLTSAQKAYRATIHFGHSTDTLDRLGQIVDSRTLELGWSRAVNWEAAIELERRRTAQVPPQFSAIKRDGVRAYAQARRGQHTELEARTVEVLELRCVSHDDRELVLDLVVSKGYYVRSLARDLCETLGVPGHLAELRRTRSGCFDVGEAVAWPPTVADSGALDPRSPSPSSPPALASISDVSRRALPTANLNAEGQDRARKGQKLWEAHFTSPPPLGLAVWLGPDGDAIAIGHAVAPEESPQKSAETTTDTAIEAQPAAAVAPFDAPEPVVFGPTFRVVRGFKARG